jgi:spore coat protein JB
METRQELLGKIDEVSFAVNDLTLYLDTHPTEAEALTLFGKYMETRKDLLKQYATIFEPLTVDCINVNDQHGTADSKYQNQAHFNWVDGPTPWEGVAF